MGLGVCSAEGLVGLDDRLSLSVEVTRKDSVPIAVCSTIVAQCTYEYEVPLSFTYDLGEFKINMIAEI